MRFINLEKLVLSNDWVERAQRARNALLACSSVEERREIIRRESALFEEVKHLLGSLSANKCWYCEVVQARSDMSVDHFRPKGEVKESPGHEGYWWLAFELENFRYSCTFCNSRRRDRETGSVGGKHSHFPLFDEASRAKAPGDDCSVESPCLLDPTDPEDPQLLWFYPNGEAAPRYGPAELEQYRRADLSISLYNLNHSKLTQRRAALAARIRRLIKSCEINLDRNPRENAAAKEQIKFAQRELLAFIDKDSELSAFARAVLRGFEDREWVKVLLHGA